MNTEWAVLKFGDVEIGDHSQNVIGTTVDGDLVQIKNEYVRGRPAFYLSEEEIRRRAAYYVPALNFDVITKSLDSAQAIALSGPPGCGGETTAIAAMRLLNPRIPIRRFALGDEDIAEISVKGKCGYLVEATGSIPSGLGSCIEAVRKAGGYLAVIVGQEDDHFAAYLPVIPVETPAPLRVYHRWLTALGINRNGWSDWDEAPALLKDALPSHAQRLGALIADITRRDDDTTPTTARRKEVSRSYRHWADQLNEWFIRNPAPQDRTLLIAAAALTHLDGTQADPASVYSLASSLARRLEVKNDGAGLAWCPVTGLHTLLDADLDDYRLIFRRHGYARAALRHVWNDYPLTRADLLTWLEELPTADAVPATLRRSLVETFAELAAEHGEADRITTAAKKWAATELADLSYIALAHTCLHRRVGRKVREKLYKWSTRRTTPQTLKLTIARVCEPLGQAYPSVALTRLKHLATHGNAQVLDQVLTAALSLAGSGHYDDVRRAAIAWSSPTDMEGQRPMTRRRRIRAGAFLFTRLAAQSAPDGIPRLLTGDAATSVDCAAGWRAALNDSAIQTLARLGFPLAVHMWLDTAVSHSHLREHITTQFVRAATPLDLVYGTDQERDRYAADPPGEVMIALVRQWAATRPANREVRQVREDIVIPLTRPWPWRLCKILYVFLRTLWEARQPTAEPPRGDEG